MKVAVVEDGNISYIHNNYLGVPKVITDSSGAVVWEGDYKPFGEMYDVNGTLSNNIRFPGQYQNEESGYSYNYFRDYDPTIGRYLQSDPIGLNGGINTYGYVYANPTAYVDRYGQISLLEIVAIGVVLFVGSTHLEFGDRAVDKECGQAVVDETNKIINDAKAGREHAKENKQAKKCAGAEDALVTGASLGVDYLTPSKGVTKNILKKDTEEKIEQGVQVIQEGKKIIE